MEEAVRKSEPSQAQAKALLDLATVFKPAKGEISVIRNYKAIEMLLFCAKWSPEGETWITEQLVNLAGNSANCRQLAKGRTISMILDRMVEVQDREPLRLAYFSLLKMACEYAFSPPTYFRTVELIASPSFHFPQELVQLYVDLLSTRLAAAPASYFQIDEKENGIVIGPVSVGEAFTVCMSFRLPEMANVSQPLLVVQGLETVLLYFKEGFLWVTKRDFEGQFPLHFLVAKWYFLAISFSMQGFAAAVDSGPPFSVAASVHL
jgi:hypothetical protein